LGIRYQNTVDFRGPSADPGAKGQYADVPLHAGLICLNGSVGMNLELQAELFAAALDELELNEDLVNQVLEITTSEDENSIDIVRYRLPTD
jgi:hypothetical protein